MKCNKQCIAWTGWNLLGNCVEVTSVALGVLAVVNLFLTSAQRLWVCLCLHGLAFSTWTEHRRAVTSASTRHVSTNNYTQYQYSHGSNLQCLYWKCIRAYDDSLIKVILASKVTCVSLFILLYNITLSIKYYIV
jgi:hypothetical protein